MEVQKYLKENGLDSLVNEFKIKVNDYPDRVVLNYDQIESPRFNPIVDECRALILRKERWEVMARSFNRFYNMGEGVQQSKDGTNMQRIVRGINNECFFDYHVQQFPFEDCRIENKLDGSLLTLYHDGDKWCVSTRKMAFAEGTTETGQQFAEIFWGVAKQYDLLSKLFDNPTYKNYSLVFELTGPANRIVTPYDKPDITLIGVRDLKDLHTREFNGDELNNIALELELNRPGTIHINDAEGLKYFVEHLPSMDEGVVLVCESKISSHWRLKLKNSKFVAIANMRANGNISPKRILKLVMENDHHEYKKYFPEDTKYFDLVEKEYNDTIERIEGIYKKYSSIESQKDFALSIIPETKYSFEKGVLFSARKNGTDIREEIKNREPKSLSESMNLKSLFVKFFNISLENEEE